LEGSRLRANAHVWRIEIWGTRFCGVIFRCGPPRPQVWEKEMKRLAMFLAILTIMTAKVFAQAPVRKIPIFFQCTCDDPVGSRIATAVRDLIAISPRYFKSGSEFTRQDANVFPIWSIRIVTRDTDENATRTMIAVAVTRGLFFETLSVQSCGSLRVKECAEGILADLDRQITDFNSVQ
jgi:hypothetical protein